MSQATITETKEEVGESTPDTSQVSIYNWLKSIGDSYTIYANNFINQGALTTDDLLQLNDNEINDFLTKDLNIKKRIHRNKIKNCIKLLKNNLLINDKLLLNKNDQNKLKEISNMYSKIIKISNNLNKCKTFLKKDAIIHLQNITKEYFNDLRHKINRIEAKIYQNITNKTLQSNYEENIQFLTFVQHKVDKMKKNVENTQTDITKNNYKNIDTNYQKIIDNVKVDLDKLDNFGDADETIEGFKGMLSDLAEEFIEDTLNNVLFDYTSNEIDKIEDIVNIEKNIIVIKPNGLNNIKTILSMINKIGYKILKKNELILNEYQLNILYNNEYNKNEKNELINKKICVLLVLKENAIDEWKKWMKWINNEFSKKNVNNVVGRIYDFEENENRNIALLFD